MSFNEVFARSGESIFTTVTRLAREHGALNLGQGFPNVRPPQPLLEGLTEAVEAGFESHQYAPSPGLPRLRKRIAALYRERYGLRYDPADEITVTSGATEALVASMYGLLNPGDRVMVFEPVYDLYVPVARRAGGSVTVLPLEEPRFELPVEQLARSIDARTRLVVLNVPHNPTGRIFSPADLQRVVDLAAEHDVYILCDEVYEQLYFSHHPPGPLPALEGARERTIRVGSTGKLFDATGWKVGWACAPPRLTGALRRAHQFTTFCAPTPLQRALVVFLGELDTAEYFASYREAYRRRREILLEGLAASPFEVIPPEGTYFAVAKVSADRVPDADPADLGLIRRLIRDPGLAAIPLSSFYVGSDPEETYLRFAFCKDEDTLREAASLLASV